MSLKRILHEIYSFRVNENYTDTVLKFSDGHIYVHWIILEAHGAIWWTLARDTNSDNIIEVILPEVSLAEGLVFVEEVYSSIQSLKILNPNSRDFTVQNTDIHLDGNNNKSTDLDIENNPSMELTIRSVEDERDIHDEDGVIEETEVRDYGGELSSTTQGCSELSTQGSGCSEELSTLDCRGFSVEPIVIVLFSVPQKHPERSTTCSVCGKTYDTREKLTNHISLYHDDTIVQCKVCKKLSSMCMQLKISIEYIFVDMSTHSSKYKMSVQVSYL